MSSIVIHELAPGAELDRQAMSRVSGGTGSSFVPGSPNINVSVGVDQHINQNQAVVVNALNNIGVIGAGFGPLKLDVSPSQFASTGFGL